MINRIIGYFFLFDLVLALFIYLAWTSSNTDVHTLTFGADFMSFMKHLSYQLDDYKIEIPNIPSIPFITNIEIDGFWGIVLNFLINFANLFFTFLNGVSNLLNFVITILNIIIKLLQFVFIVLTNFNNMRDSLISQ